MVNFVDYSNLVIGLSNSSLPVVILWLEAAVEFVETAGALVLNSRYRCDHSLLAMRSGFLVVGVGGGAEGCSLLCIAASVTNGPDPGSWKVPHTILQSSWKGGKGLG